MLAPHPLVGGAGRLTMASSGLLRREADAAWIGPLRYPERRRRTHAGRNLQVMTPLQPSEADALDRFVIDPMILDPLIQQLKGEKGLS